MAESALALEMMKTTGKLFFGMKPGHNHIRSMMHGEMFILDYLERKNLTAMPGELSSMTGGSSARTAIALRNLEQKGYISRDIDKADRRKILVSLTEEGRALTLEERAQIIRRMNAIVEALGENDVREYIRIVDRIVEISNNMNEDSR
jgi:DNA-binding MarR family transcriptional regulator